MGLSNSTNTLSLVLEGIATVDDIADWDDNDWDQWNYNCKKPVRVQDTKVKPRLASSSGATFRFQLGVNQSVGSEFPVEDFPVC